LRSEFFAAKHKAMDPVTHMLAGAALARAGPERRYGRAALWVMALASEFPDVDQLVLMFTADPFYIASRRTFSHCLLGGPIVALFAAGIFRLICRGVPFRSLYWMCLLSTFVHVFLDLINSFGVVLFYPLSYRRFELASVFIVDLALTGILLAPLVLELFPPLRDKGRLVARLALGLAVCYIGLCLSLRAAADRLLDRERLGRPVSFQYVFPEPLGPLRWRGVLKSGDEIRVFLLRPLRRVAEQRQVLRTAESQPLVAGLRHHPVALRLEWFFKCPVWGLEKRVGGGYWASVYDLRFTSLVIDRGSIFTARFELDEGGNVLSAGWSY